MNSTLSYSRSSPQTGSCFLSGLSSGGRTDKTGLSAMVCICTCVKDRLADKEEERKSCQPGQHSTDSHSPILSLVSTVSLRQIMGRGHSESLWYIGSLVHPAIVQGPRGAQELFLYGKLSSVVVVCLVWTWSCVSGLPALLLSRVVCLLDFCQSHSFQHCHCLLAALSVPKGGLLSCEFHRDCPS